MRLLFLLVVVVRVAACCFRLIFFHVFIFVLCLRAQRLPPPPISLPRLVSRLPNLIVTNLCQTKLAMFFFLGSKPPLQPQPFGTDFILAFSSYINCLKLIIQILQTTKGGTQQKSIVINLNRRQVESVELPTESLSWASFFGVSGLNFDFILT